MEKRIRKCAVIGAAPVTDGSVFDEMEQGSYVICADGGMDSALKYGLKPDLVIGDFDSTEMESPPAGVETIRLKTEKDDTDMLAAVMEGLKRGYRDFVLYGALGGERFDHSFANLCVLQYLVKNGCKALICDGHCRVFLINDGRLILSGVSGKTVSVYPFGGASCMVSYMGLKYPLTRAVLTSDNPRGTSNVVVGSSAQITVHSGSALIIVER